MSDGKESTCKREKCPKWDNNFVDGNCPNFMYTTWVNKEESMPKVLDDCAPQRTVLMLMDMHNHIMGMKEYASQTRNMLSELIENTKSFMIEQENSREHVKLIIGRIEERQERMIRDQKKVSKKT